MDLLGDLGQTDQLTSARAENAVLQQKVKELTAKVKALTVQNESLLAEVEVYRKERALSDTAKLKAGDSSGDGGGGASTETDDMVDEFVKSGNGVYPSENAVTLENLHQDANLLCCSMHPDDSLLAVGGADSHVSLCQWGAALAPSPDAAAGVVSKAARLRCPAPVICVHFSQQNFGKTLPVIAAGCMDGSVKLACYGVMGGITATLLEPSAAIKHAKYVKNVLWCPNKPLLATSSADGTVTVSKISALNEDKATITVEPMETLHMSATIESICFSKDGRSLICYARDTPYLSYFDLEDNFKQTKMNLNRGAGAASGGFEDHVSFAVMDMALSPNGKYLALATDTSRNIVMDAATGKHIRNLYGHTNDGFSNPKIGWSSNGQYIFGNTQEDGSLCVWDVASSSIVKRLEGHANPVRDLFSSTLSDTLVTTSFDKGTRIWLTPM